jgi:branched-chain amino acid transport system substrate-binding protein
LEKIQTFKAMGVDLIIGGRWSSQAYASLSYINENNMLLFSPSSTSPVLSIPNDNLFRLGPTDLIQVPAIAEMLWSWGIEAIIVIQRGDSWADGIYNNLVIEYPARGGVIAERIRYATEVTEFSSYLAVAEAKAQELVAQYGAEHVAIELISFEESVTIVSQAADYPTIYNLYWFGSDGTALSSQLCDEAPIHADHLKIFSTMAAPSYSDKYFELNDRYISITSRQLSFYDACDYDIAWIIAKAVLEAQSEEAVDVIPLLSQICNDMFGVSGWCRLNENGDRYSANYDIWGFGYVGPDVQSIKYGYYDSATGDVFWYTDVLGFNPPGHG